MRSLFTIAATLLVFSACATGPKNFSQQDFQANKQDYIDTYSDVSSGGILKASKKIIVPSFKVYFQTKSSGSNSNETFMKSATSSTQLSLELQLDRKVMQELVDKAYAKTLDDLKLLGYEVIDANELASISPEYKKYLEGDRMKKSPQDIDGRYLEFAPTGMKLELSGEEVKTHGFSNFGNKFGTKLSDVVNGITDKINAISIQPVLMVGVGIYDKDSSMSSIDVKAKQGLSVMVGTRYVFSQDNDFGQISLQEPIVAEAQFGKLVEASTAVDNVNEVISFINSLGGGKQRTSNTYRLEANAEQYRAAAWPLIEATQEIFRERVKNEL